MSGKVVEILHDTGLHIASMADYRAKLELTKVASQNSSTGVCGVWGWKEDTASIGSHSPSARMDGTSFVKYPAKVSDSIENYFVQWEKGLIGDTLNVDLTADVQKVRNWNTGLVYEINFNAMVQTNTQTGFTRALRRELHFKSGSWETLKKLPPIPRRKPRGFSILPTFSGQLIAVTKTVSFKQNTSLLSNKSRYPPTYHYY